MLCVLCVCRVEYSAAYVEHIVYIACGAVCCMWGAVLCCDVCKVLCAVCLRTKSNSWFRRLFFSKTLCCPQYWQCHQSNRAYNISN